MSLEKIKTLDEVKKALEEMTDKVTEENKTDLENNRQISIDKIVNYLYEIVNSVDIPFIISADINLIGIRESRKIVIRRKIKKGMFCFPCIFQVMIHDSTLE